MMRIAAGDAATGSMSCAEGLCRRGGGRRAALLLAVAAATTLPANVAAQSSEPPSLVGEWRSAGCEPRTYPDGTKAFTKRTFYFQAVNWAADFHSFVDADCAQPFMTIRLSGPYAVRDPSSAVSGAYDAEFFFTEGDVTAHSEAAAQFLNGGAAGSCGRLRWSSGARQTITQGGCAALNFDFDAHNVEFETIRVQGDELRFGQRPADGSWIDRPGKRPRALGFPVRRVASR